MLSGLFLLLLAVAMFFPEIRRHAQNWVSLVLTAAVAVGGLLVCSLLAALLVTVFADDSRIPGISSPTWVDVTINVLSTLLVLAVFYAAFRSRRAVDPLTEDGEARLWALLERHGERDSLGYFALRREKSVVWSPTGKAGVVPGRGRGGAGLRGSGRRPGGVAGGHRAVAGPGA